ncbi:hypothetical protein A8950_2541 [Dongia mobilis]|uniref:2-oxoglutarate-Fe(II)-dependent oxygenase superfamily protein n=1 Tax=Dongia mobilis TaxID=578943 RepID=A0A4R6WS80_9PROT|nr:2OG-Fe(II) oxygenase [Dongia mobilis]TDQ81473.1 hypothetical protein A8950_2541 [Dongia mobilis]
MLAATATIQAPHMLETVRPDQVATDPYPHHARQNAVPAEIYQQLEAEFPSLDMILNGRTDVGSNVAVRMTVKQVLGDRRISPLWREFFEYHTSADYWRHVTRLFGDHFRRAFPTLEEKMGRRFEDWRVVPRGFGGDAELRLDCQFVMNTPVTTEVSSVKTPHVDLCDKIFSALFYFRDPRDSVTGGDLDIYAWNREPRFIKHRSIDRDVKLVKTVPYAANTYVCFLNSENAVHGVSPRGLTEVPRRYINFIAELPFHAFEPKQLNKLQRMFFASEVREAAQDDKY